MRSSLSKSHVKWGSAACMYPTGDRKRGPYPMAVEEPTQHKDTPQELPGFLTSFYWLSEHCECGRDQTLPMCSFGLCSSRQPSSPRAASQLKLDLVFGSHQGCRRRTLLPSFQWRHLDSVLRRQLHFDEESSVLFSWLHWLNKVSRCSSWEFGKV